MKSHSLLFTAHGEAREYCEDLPFCFSWGVLSKHMKIIFTIATLKQADKPSKQETNKQKHFVGLKSKQNHRMAGRFKEKK